MQAVRAPLFALTQLTPGKPICCVQHMIAHPQLYRADQFAHPSVANVHTHIDFAVRGLCLSRSCGLRSMMYNRRRRRKTNAHTISEFMRNTQMVIL
jgi:hypothetical protein